MISRNCHLFVVVFILISGRLLAQTYTIPVVFHVLHDNGPENISDAQIYDCMSILNTGFNEGFGESIQPPFDTLVADMDIEFCLASMDPQGIPTTGIERIETPLTHEGGIDAAYINQWPRDRYLNIWTVASNTGDSSNITSLLPELVDQDPTRDGVMVMHFFIGSNGTALQGQSRGICLSVGRYLNLKLLWQDSTGVGGCGDDEVADTPPMEFSAICFQDAPSCVPGVNANTENFMTYTLCNRMFTPGQNERVYTALNSNVAQRNLLWTAANLASTGCGVTSITDGYTMEDELSFYPNPVVDQLQIMAKENVYEFQIIDPLGKQVFKTRVGKGLSLIHISEPTRPY